MGYRMDDKPKRKTTLDELLNDFKELTSVYSLSNRNARGAKKFAKLNPKSKFARLTKKLWSNKWLGLNDEKKDVPLWDKYSQELEFQSQRILNELMDENGIITLENNVKLVTDKVNPSELVHQIYNIFYCNPLLPNKEVNFRNACGPMYLSFLENVNYEGSYEIVGSSTDEGDTNIDVGASYGLWAIMCIKVFGAKKVYCFEPNDEARQIMLRNRELNGLTSEEMPVYSYAIGPKKKTAVLYTKANTQCTGIVKDRDPDARMCPTHEMKIVNVITLDDFIHHLDEKCRSISNTTGYYEPPIIDFVKINVNGAEAGVIKGGSYFFTYMDKLPDLYMTIYKTPDLYKEIEEALQYFNVAYSFRLRVAKLHAFFASNVD